MSGNAPKLPLIWENESQFLTVPIASVPHSERKTPPPQPKQHGKVQPKFREVFSPTPSLIQHPLSGSRPRASSETTRSQAHTIPDLHYEIHALAPQRSHDTSRALPPVSLRRRIAGHGSFLGSKYSSKLLDIRKFLPLITGMPAESYCVSGNEFQEELDGASDLLSQVTEDYDCLWLDFQFFWDLMLRMSPSSITENLKGVEIAVDLMMDLVACRMAFRVRDDCTPVIAQQQIREFRRRLQHLTLYLRQDMWSCGKNNKLLCSCVNADEYRENKQRPWSGFFDFPRCDPEEKTFTTRDIANLFDLEDFLACLSDEEKRKYPKGARRAPEHVGYQGAKFFDDTISNLLPRHIRSDEELRGFWMRLFCCQAFRNHVSYEVWTMVNEAKAHAEHGFYFSSHRRDCPSWTPPKSKTKKILRGLKGLASSKR